MNVPLLIAAFLLGYVVRGHTTGGRTRRWPSATSTGAKALAGNPDAQKTVDEARALARAGDVDATEFVADLGAAYMMAELNKHIVDTEIALESEQKAAA